MSKNNDIYKMKLNEDIFVNGNSTITRVPGGWLYCTYFVDTQNQTGFASQVFVPYNEEFKDNDENI